MGNYPRLVYTPETYTPVLTPVLAAELNLILPPRHQIAAKWQLAFSLHLHGVSLSTLYKKCAQLELSRTDVSGWLLVVRDDFGHVFGAYLNERPHAVADHYYGNGECFLWTTGLSNKSADKRQIVDGNEDDDLKFKAFAYTGLNDYMIFSDAHFLSVGGG